MNDKRKLSNVETWHAKIEVTVIEVIDLPSTNQTCINEHEYMVTSKLTSDEHGVWYLFSHQRAFRSYHIVFVMTSPSNQR